MCNRNQQQRPQRPVHLLRRTTKTTTSQRERRTKRVRAQGECGFCEVDIRPALRKEECNEKSIILDSILASQLEQARDEQRSSSARKEEDCEDGMILLDFT
jgi:hypothetical protein